MTMTVCPVRLFSAEVSALFALFYLTHELGTSPGGVPRWARVALPGAGGIEDQPGRELDGLEIIRQAWNGLYAAASARRRGGAPGRG